MTFEAGVPKSVNGKEMKVSEIITELNRLGGKHESESLISLKTVLLE